MAQIQPNDRFGINKKYYAKLQNNFLNHQKHSFLLTRKS